MNKKYLVVSLAVLVAIVLGGVAASSLQKDEPSNISSAVQSPGREELQTTKKAASGESVTKVGTFTCATPEATNGVQTMSCALSLQEDNGTTYPLNATDPMVLAGIPTGQRIQVDGILQDSGVIAVESIQKL